MPDVANDHNAPPAATLAARLRLELQDAEAAHDLAAARVATLRRQLDWLREAAKREST